MDLQRGNYAAVTLSGVQPSAQPRRIGYPLANVPAGRKRRLLTEPRRPRRAELPAPSPGIEHRVELRCAVCARRAPGRRAPVLGLLEGPARGRRWHVLRADYDFAWYGRVIDSRTVSTVCAYYQDNGVRWVSECVRGTKRDKTGRLRCPTCGHRPGVGHERLAQMADAAVQAGGTPVLLI